MVETVSYAVQNLLLFYVVFLDIYSGIEYNPYIKDDGSVCAFLEAGF